MIVCEVMCNAEDGDKLLRKKSKIDHVLYEFEMYLLTYKLLCAEKMENQFLFNLLFESHQIHLRILIEFFTENVSTNSNSSSIIISNILSDTSIKRILCHFGKKEKKPLKKIRSIINCSIAHMNKVRYDSFTKKTVDENITEATKRYIPQAYPIITGIISKFLKELTDDIIEQNLSPDYTKDARERIFRFFKRNRDNLIGYLNKPDESSIAENITDVPEIVMSDNNFKTSSFDWPDPSAEINSFQANVGIGTSGGCNDCIFHY